MFVYMQIFRQFSLRTISSRDFDVPEISDVDECVVERGKDTGYAKDELSISDLGAEGDVLLGGSCGFLWWHFGRCGIELS